MVYGVFSASSFHIVSNGQTLCCILPNNVCWTVTIVVGSDRRLCMLDCALMFPSSMHLWVTPVAHRAGNTVWDIVLKSYTNLARFHEQTVQTFAAVSCTGSPSCKFVLVFCYCTLCTTANQHSLHNYYTRF